VKRVIECVNCGGGGNDWQLWVTVGALIVAALALLMNFVQFREFIQRSKARARFVVKLRAPRAEPDGVLRTPGTAYAARVEIGIKNDGEKGAGETLINAVMPRHVDRVRWCGPNGEELDLSDMVSETDEVLHSSDGQEFEGQYLARKVDGIGRRPHHVVFFQFYVNVPDDGMVLVPIRVRVQAEELPEDIEEYVVDYEVRVERQHPGIPNN
jgi:hypothetical protein